MKKTRNTFFQESSYQSYNPNMQMMPNNGQMMPNANMPYQQASNYFYAGPMPNNYNTNNTTNDIESRFAKIERQLNRLDYRISKLEGANNIVTTDEYENNTTNMYML